MIRGSAVALTSFLACSSPARAPTTPADAAPRDPAAHTVTMVEVAPDVSLEVLDFGGTGEPLVLLAGLGLSGHVFDELAPALVGKHHVYAITRRGTGYSSSPSDGYEVATRVADDVAVLDALGLARVVLVGHSMAGDELTGVAGQHPDRVRAIVYLDAASDQLLVTELEGKAPPQPPPAPEPESYASPAAAQQFATDQLGITFPLGEFLSAYEFAPDGHSVGERASPESLGKIIEGTTHPDYSLVTCPALVLYATYASPEEALGTRWEALDEASRAAWQEFFPQAQALEAQQRAALETSLPSAQFVAYTGTNHFFFLMQPAKVVADLEAFLMP